MLFLLVLASWTRLVVEAGHGVRGFDQLESSSPWKPSKYMGKGKEEMPATDPPTEIVPLDSFPQWQAEVGYWVGEYTCEWYSTSYTWSIVMGCVCVRVCVCVCARNT